VKKKILIIRFGSIGRKHAAILKKNRHISKIYIFSNQKNIPYNIIKNLNSIDKLGIDNIIIATHAKSHIKYLRYIEKNLKNKNVLIEKPLFEKEYLVALKANNYSVGYNLRFHPLINLIKKKINKKKIWFYRVFSSSYLPYWRKNIHYSKSASGMKKYGGGALLELSHELDFSMYLLGDLKPSKSMKKKLSNLNIDVDDIYEVNGFTKSKTYFNISANFFSKNEARDIIIEGENLSIKADLIKNEIQIIENNKEKKIQLKKFNMNETYNMEHNELISGSLNYSCNLKDGKKVLKLIDKINKLS